MATRLTILIVSLSAGIGPYGLAEDSPLEPPKVISAATKSIALIQKSSREYRNHRTCFSCHHQALPVLALIEAKKRGFDIDDENLRAQLELTAKHLEGGKKNYLQGRGQGGRADTAGYALWTLEVGQWPADETTSAVTHYLTLWHKDTGHWRCTSNRPPSEASDFTTTYLAVRALTAFGTRQQAQTVDDRIDAARQWVISTEPKDMEDRVFRLRTLSYLEESQESIDAAIGALVEAQHDDGGWSQKVELDSDAYATGSVLATLYEYGDMPTSDTVYQRGLRFLLANQLEDGSWHVHSRSKPFQTYFESGFPHGHDQFISIAASSWASLALMYAGPTPDEKTLQSIDDQH